MWLLTAVACSPPEVRVSILPEAPTTVDALRVNALADMVSVDWFVDGKRWGRGPVVPSDSTKRGEVWQVVATTSDGEGTASVVIVNRPPIISVGAPDTQPGAPLTLALDATDADGDPLTIGVEWAEGSRRFDTRVPAGLTQSGEVWTASFWVNDGHDEVTGEVQVVVGSGVPVVDASVEPASPRRYDVVRAVATVEDDDDDPDLSFAWWVNDARVQVGPDPVLTSPFVRGDQLRVDVEAWDGVHRVKATASVVVANTPPGSPVVQTSRATGVAQHHDVMCTVGTLHDADDDQLETSFVWSDGTTSHVGAHLPAAVATVGEWTCTAMVSDGTGSSVGTASSHIRLARNILVLLVDDLGVDKVAAYGEHPDPPPTPTIDGLAAAGVLFRNAYTNPVCSPSRLAVLSGRQPGRAGVGPAFGVKDGDYYVPIEERLTPELLAHSPWPVTSIALGKWHLSGELGPYGAEHPLLQGFLHHYGAPGGLPQAWLDTPDAGYFLFDKAIDGDLITVEAYATSDTVDDALALIDTLPEPWFAHVAFNAIHGPVHDPPSDLHSFDLMGADKHTRVDAMVEALDTEIARLLDGLGPERLADTTVVFMGDNGTPLGFVREPWEPAGAKRTLYEGGINVPLIVSGPFVDTPGAEAEGLVQGIDLLPTFVEMLAVPEAVVAVGPPLDGVSFLPMLAAPTETTRSSVYVQFYEPVGGPPHDHFEHAVLRGGFKLIARDDGTEELYDLRGRVDDGPNLLEAALGAEADQAYGTLAAELVAQRADVVFEYEGLIP